MDKRKLREDPDAARRNASMWSTANVWITAGIIAILAVFFIIWIS